MCSAAPIALPVRAGREHAPELAGTRVVSSFAAAAALEPTVAIIATDTSRHLTDAAAWLEAGCHVLVEKPLAATLAGVSALIDLAATKNLLVHVACCLRFHQTVTRFRELLPMLGHVHDVRIECQSYLPDWRPERDYRESYSARASEGGAMRDLIHEIDYAMWLFGRPLRVSASLRSTGLLGIEAEESASISWEAAARASGASGETAGGAHVSLQLDYLTRPSRRVLRAVGQNGTLTADLIAQTVTLTHVSGAGLETRAHATPQDRDAMMVAQAHAFLDLVTNGAPSVGATIDDGAAAVAVCDAARASSASRAITELPSW